MARRKYLRFVAAMLQAFPALYWFGFLVLGFLAAFVIPGPLQKIGIGERERLTAVFGSSALVPYVVWKSAIVLGILSKREFPLFLMAIEAVLIITYYIIVSGTRLSVLSILYLVTLFSSLTLYYLSVRNSEQSG